MIAVAYSWAFFYGVVLPQLVLTPTLRSLWWRIADHNGVARTAILRDVIFLPAIVGMIERVLYVAAILAGAPEFIGVWLAIKVAGGWKGWSETRQYKWSDSSGQVCVGEVPGRQEYNLFLVGSGLSILFALVAAYSIKWMRSGDAAQALLVDGALLVASLLLMLYARPRDAAKSGDAS